MPRPESTNPPRPFPLFRLPPPLLFAAAFALGLLAQQYVPLPGWPHDRLLMVGLAVAAIGACLALWLPLAFLRHRTTLNPFGAPTALLTSGPYRFSRNPMYVSLVLVYLGTALVYGSPWPLLLLAAPLAILSRVVVPFEEARLRAAFGERYDDYATRVRRWL